MIPFTQYLRPFGEKKPVEIDRPADVEAAAHRLIDLGCKFDIEELRTLQISMTCECDEFEDDEVLAHEICANGPPVLVAVDRLVAVATKQYALKMIERTTGVQS